MEMVQKALEKDSTLSGIEGFVSDTGEGRWAVEEAVHNSIPYSVNTEAVYSRFSSRNTDDFAHRLLAAMRNKFGGHDIKKA